MLYIKIRRYLDSNQEPLVKEVTALPTEPQDSPYDQPTVYKESLSL